MIADQVTRDDRDDWNNILDHLHRHRSHINKIVINQPSGLGDILYTMQIGLILSNLGFEVLWPIIDQYGWLCNVFANSGVTFISQTLFERSMRNIVTTIAKSVLETNEPVICNEICYIPLVRSLYNHRGKKAAHQHSKYVMLGLDGFAENWATAINPTFNPYKIRSLHNNLCRGGGAYIFCNNMIGSPNGYHEIVNRSIPCTKSKYPIVYNSYIKGYNPFDWAEIYSGAKEIHTPDTSLVYVIEILIWLGLLDPSSTKLYLYHRDGRNPSMRDFSYLNTVISPFYWNLIEAEH
jgi:hypothetical protein